MGKKKEAPPVNKADAKAAHALNCERLRTGQDSVETLARRVGHHAAVDAAHDVIRHRVR